MLTLVCCEQPALVSLHPLPGIPTSSHCRPPHPRVLWGMALPPSPPCSDPLPELTASADQPWTCHTVSGSLPGVLQGLSCASITRCLEQGRAPRGPQALPPQEHTHRISQTHQPLRKHPVTCFLRCETFVYGGSLEGSFLINPKRRNQRSLFSAPRVNCVLIREWAE